MSQDKNLTPKNKSKVEKMLKESFPENSDSTNQQMLSELTAFSRAVSDLSNPQLRTRPQRVNGKTTKFMTLEFNDGVGTSDSIVTSLIDKIKQHVKKSSRLLKKIVSR